jgi:hypothetical protein
LRTEKDSEQEFILDRGCEEGTPLVRVNEVNEKRVVVVKLR